MRDIYLEYTEFLDAYLYLLKKKLATRKIYPKEYNEYYRKLIEWDNTFIDRFHIIFKDATHNGGI